MAGVSILELAALLDGVQVADLSSGEVVGVVQGFEQLIRAAQAAQAVAIHELEVRRPVHPSPVPDELACALVTTRRVGGDAVRARVAGVHATRWCWTRGRGGAGCAQGRRADG